MIRRSGALHTHRVIPHTLAWELTHTLILSWMNMHLVRLPRPQEISCSVSGDRLISHLFIALLIAALSAHLVLEDNCSNMHLILKYNLCLLYSCLFSPFSTLNSGRCQI